MGRKSHEAVAPDEPHLQIGEVAGRTKVTQRTLRFYEEKGLLKPPSRMEGGFRLYSEEDITRVEQIKELQQLDRILRSTVDATSRDETRHDAAGHATPRHDGSDNSTGKIAELEQKNLQLTIDRAAKEQVINHLVKERKEHVAQMTEQGRQIGILETRLKQIEVPSDQAREPHRTTELPQKGEGDNRFSENQEDDVQLG